MSTVTITVWVLLTLWSTPQSPEGGEILHEADWSMYFTEKECEANKKIFIIKRTRQLTGEDSDSMRKFSAGCNSATINYNIPEKQHEPSDTKSPVRKNLVNI